MASRPIDRGDAKKFTGQLVDKVPTRCQVLRCQAHDIGHASRQTEWTEGLDFACVSPLFGPLWLLWLLCLLRSPRAELGQSWRRRSEASSPAVWVVSLFKIERCGPRVGSGTDGVERPAKACVALNA